MNNNNILYIGAPGTGKTHKAIEDAKEFVRNGQNLSDKEIEDRMKFVYLHSSYDNQSFISGISVTTTDSGQANYETVDKVFKELCDKANNNKDKHYAIVLDDIQNVRISEVFGEAMSAIENRDEPVTLANGKTLTVPKDNLKIIATMSTLKSKFGIDYAFLRRFNIHTLNSDKQELHDILQNQIYDFFHKNQICKNGQEIIEKYTNILNSFDTIKEFVDGNISDECKKFIDQYYVGHCYFIPPEDAVNPYACVQHKIRHQVIPLLEQYVKDGILKCSIGDVKDLRNRLCNTKYTTEYKDVKADDTKIDISNLGRPVSFYTYSTLKDIKKISEVFYPTFLVTYLIKNQLLSNFDVLNNIFFNKEIITRQDKEKNKKNLPFVSADKNVYISKNDDKTAYSQSEFFEINGKNYFRPEQIAYGNFSYLLNQDGNNSRTYTATVIYRIIDTFYKVYIGNIDTYLNANPGDENMENMKEIRKIAQYEYDSIHIKKCEGVSDIDRHIMQQLLLKEYKDKKFVLINGDYGWAGNYYTKGSVYKKKIKVQVCDFGLVHIIPNLQILNAVVSGNNNGNGLQQYKEVNIRDKINVDSLRESVSALRRELHEKFGYPQEDVTDEQINDAISKMKLYVADDSKKPITVKGVYKVMCADYKQVMDSLNVHQMILQGPPGTSKTYGAKEFICKMIGLEQLDEDRLEKHKLTAEDYETKNLDSSKYFPENEKNVYWDIVQFHPSYTYEDFVRGIAVETSVVTDETTDEDKTNKKHNILYKTVNKILGKMAKLASNNSDKEFYLVIDEINRANMATVFGELIYALEYRNKTVETPYCPDEDRNNKDGSNIKIPDNLYIIGTMNTADKSINGMDYAIRRRFLFFPMLPEEKVVRENVRAYWTNEDGNLKYNENSSNEDLNKELTVQLFNAVAAIFDKNKPYLNSDYYPDDVQVGHTYFLINEEISNKVSTANEKLKNLVNSNENSTNESNKISDELRKLLEKRIANTLTADESQQLDKYKFTDDDKKALEDNKLTSDQLKECIKCTYEELMKNRLNYQIIPILREYYKDGILENEPKKNESNDEKAFIAGLNATEYIYYFAAKGKMIENMQELIDKLAKQFSVKTTTDGSSASDSKSGTVTNNE